MQSCDASGRIKQSDRRGRRRRVIPSRAKRSCARPARRDRCRRKGSSRGRRNCCSSWANARATLTARSLARWPESHREQARGAFAEPPGASERRQVPAPALPERGSLDAARRQTHARAHVGSEELAAGLVPRAAVRAMPARLLLLCLLFRSSWLTVEDGRSRRRHSAASPGRTAAVAVSVGVAGGVPLQNSKSRRSRCSRLLLLGGGRSEPRAAPAHAFRGSQARGRRHP